MKSFTVLRTVKGSSAVPYLGFLLVIDLSDTKSGKAIIAEVDNLTKNLLRDSLVCQLFEYMTCINQTH